MKDKLGRTFARRADFSVLRAWMVRNHRDSTIHDAKVAANLEADRLDTELYGLNFPALPDMSDMAKMAYLARFADSLGLQVSDDSGEIVIRGWIK